MKNTKKSTLVKVLLTQPLSYAVLLTVILASFKLDLLALISFGATILIALIWWARTALKPSRMKKNYLVKEGGSFCSHRLTLHLGRTKMSGEFTPWEKAKYPRVDDNPGQINKVAGLSFGFHHDNSIRVGIRYNQDNTFGIFAYVYINGERKTQVLTTVMVRTKVKYQLELLNGYYLISLYDVNNNPLASWKTKAEGVESKWGYFLFPYFENATTNWEIENQFYR